MSDPVELLERRLRRVIAGEEDTVGLHFFCQIGGRYDEYGITTLQISGSGWALVSWRGHETDTLMFSYQLSDEDMRKFYSVIDDHPFWRENVSRRKSEGDETNLHFRLSEQNKGLSHGVQFWSGDLDDHPVLQGLTDRVCKMVRSLSEDDIQPLVPDAA